MKPEVPIYIITEHGDTRDICLLDPEGWRERRYTGLEPLQAVKLCDVLNASRGFEYGNST